MVPWLLIRLGNNSVVPPPPPPPPPPASTQGGAGGFTGRAFGNGYVTYRQRRQEQAEQAQTATVQQQSQERQERQDQKPERFVASDGKALLALMDLGNGALALTAQPFMDTEQEISADDEDAIIAIILAAVQ